MSVTRLEGRPQRWSSSLAVITIAVLLLASCRTEGDEAAAPSTDGPRAQRGISYIPWSDGLNELDAETVEWVAGFTESVPDDLPEYALPQVHFIDPTGFATGGEFTAPIVDGAVRVRFVVGNPSMRRNRAETILCLRNYEQTPCGADEDTWDVALPGMTMAFFALHLRANAGDRFHVLLIPSEQPGYPFPSAVSFPIFAERRPPLAAVSVEAPRHERVWPWEGCGFARILIDLPPIESHRIPVTVARDAELFLLLERCEEDETLRLLAIGDRGEVVPVPGMLWNSTLRMASRTALIPIDPAWFSGVSEFQIVVLRDEFGSGRGSNAWFSDAVSFAD